ncbi:ras guanine nucleotide exchange factor domain-containing protein [Gaertneriomyces semiglobifer]|nr:ras guanine nucleotide exchange factor domain-containing protein [Gaertneriomyces semiglobifer]
MAQLLKKESRASLVSEDNLAGNDYLLRIQLPNDMTTVIQVQSDMTMWEILCVISSKKQLTPSQHVVRAVFLDGKSEPIDEGRVLNSYVGLERIVLQRKNVPDPPVPRVPNGRGRRASIVMNAPKPANIRMVSEEFPKTVTDEVALAMRIGNAKAEISKRSKTLKTAAMALLFSSKKSLSENGEGSPISMRGSRTPSEFEQSTSSIGGTEDRYLSLPRSKAGQDSPDSEKSSPASVESDLDTLASKDYGENRLPSLPSLPPLPTGRRFSGESTSETPRNVRRSVTSLGLSGYGGEDHSRTSLASSASVALSGPELDRASSDLVDTRSLDIGSTMGLDGSDTLSRVGSLVARDLTSREKIRKRTISSPAASGSGYATLRRPVLRTNRQRSNTDVLTGIETAIELEKDGQAPVDSPASSVATPVTPDDAKRAVLKVSLPDDQTTTIMIQPELTMETVLLNICQKRQLDFDQYTLEVPHANGQVTIEMDRQLGHYMNEYGINEVNVVRKEKTYSTMCVSEGGRDVMILQLISGKLQVMAATPEKLIERVTDDAEQDNRFLDTLLLTFRSFINPTEFFDQLVARFNAELPPDPSPEDVEYFSRMKIPTQRRVVAAFKWWVKHHYHDFGVNGSLKADLDDFIDQIRHIDDGEYAQDAIELYDILDKQNELYEEMINNYKTVERRGKTIEGMIDEISVEDLSQQLCLHDFKLFHNIHPIEYLNTIWGSAKDASPSMIYFTDRFDKESYWTVTEILRQKDFKKRVNLLRKFIQTAKASEQLNNFFTMFAIITALCKPVVQRLKKTWEALPEKVKKAWVECEKMVDPSRNMKNYRDLAAHARPPIVPFLPIYVKDLTFMNDGNASRIGEEKQMINFDKLRMMGNRVKEISALAHLEYSFEPKPAIQNFLSKPPVEKNEAKLKEWSLECEKQA